MIVLITGGSSGSGESITRKIAAESGYKAYFLYNTSLESTRQIDADFPNTTAVHSDKRSFCN